MSEKKTKSIKINAFFNSFKSVLTILFPLVTFPYVSRVLGANKLGIINYSQAIVSYFSLIASLGISTYAVREGAKIRDDFSKLNNFCNEVFTINIITTVIGYLAMFVCCIVIERSHNYFYLIILLSISIVFNTIGVDWINVIFEDYVYVTIRGVILQLVNLILLFIFVKDENDYITYAFLTITPQIFIGIFNFFYCRRYCRIHITKRPHISMHIKPMLILFVNNIAVTLYCNADSIMIGWLISDYYVGIYAVAVKIYSMIRSLLASIFTVCIPRISYYIGNKESEKCKSLLSSLVEGLIILICPVVVGIEVLAKEIVLIISGSEYIGAINTLRILSIGIIFAIFGGILTNCINIPSKKEKNNLYATFAAAFVNVALNITLIPLYKQNGAAVTTVIAEICVVVVCILLDNNILRYFNWKKILLNFSQTVIGCIGIVMTKVITSHFVFNSWANCIITTILSIFIYIFIMSLLRNIYVIDIICKFQFVKRYIRREKR